MTAFSTETAGVYSAVDEALEGAVRCSSTASTLDCSAGDFDVLPDHLLRVHPHHTMAIGHRLRAHPHHTMAIGHRLRAHPHHTMAIGHRLRAIHIHAIW